MRKNRRLRNNEQEKDEGALLVACFVLMSTLRSRARQRLDHRKIVKEGREMREISFNYWFQEDETDARIRTRVYDMFMKRFVSMKGRTEQLATMKLLSFIQKYDAAESEISLKNDQELTNETLMTDVVNTRGEVITASENSCVDSSDSNRVVEGGTSSVEGLIRTLFLAYEERMGTKSSWRKSSWFSL